MTAASRQVVDSGEIAFQVEARLLQELGERLVASPDVALLELVKNASDADAPSCRVSLETKFGKPVLIIADNGVGMTLDDFRNRWMRIAVDSKRDRLTRRFARAVTGQKGIGRFAIRFLGASLKLESVSIDHKASEKQMLEAVFDWRRLDKQSGIQDAKVQFRVTRVPGDTPTGTRLTVSRLKQDLRDSLGKSLLTKVLQIVSPLTAFNAGPFARTPGKTTVNRSNDLTISDVSPVSYDQDPGFSVAFTGFESMPAEDADLGKSILNHAWARLTISLVDDRLKYSVLFRGEVAPQELEIKYPNNIQRGLHADIAYAPKRKNAFAGLPTDGREIWSWIRTHSGVGIVDNSFRIRPYGFNDDDWLYLNQDGIHSERQWRTKIAMSNFPQSEIELARPGLCPALNIATTFQLVGSVFVESRASNNPDELDLVPAMDREGFISNAAYGQMVEVVRGGLEFLAKIDKTRSLQAKEREAEDKRLSLQGDLSQAVEEIKIDPRLANEEKAALVEHYSSLATRVQEQEEYDRNARQRLEIAAGLGVVAGFMTHEAERLFIALDRVIDRLSRKANPSSVEAEDLRQVRDARSQLDGYIRYTRLYTESLRTSNLESFSALGQIEWVCDNFSATAKSRHIKTEIECNPDVLTPPIPVAMYSAVLLNLYTNAVKAVIARVDDDKSPCVSISAWNDQRNHYLSVQDTGIGIPPSLQKRIWDPFFTTTSRVNSPLGTGMGLGLSLVRDLVERQGGKVGLSAASPEFTTCVLITLPRNANGH